MNNVQRRIKFVSLRILRGTLFFFYRFGTVLFVSISLILLSAYLLIQSTTFQNWAIEKTTTFLSNELKTTVKIEHIDLNIHKHLVLNGLYVADHCGDTLLATRSLSTHFDLNLGNLLQKIYTIDGIDLTGARIFLRRDVGQYDNNMQFLLDYFDPPKPDDGAPKKPLIDLRLSYLNIFDTHFINDDNVGGQTLQASIKKANIDIKNMNLPQKHIDIKNVNLDGLAVTILKKERHPLPPKFVSTPTIQAPPLSQDTTQKKTLSIAVDAFQLRNGHFALDDFRNTTTFTPEPNKINYKHLFVTNIGIDIKNFEYEDMVFKGKVEGISLREQSGLEISKLAADDAYVSATDTKLYGVRFVTPYSMAGDTVLLSYSQFPDFEEFPDNVSIDVRLHDAHIALRDVMGFAPGLWDNTFFTQNKNLVPSLSGRFTGLINRLKSDDFTLELEKQLKIKGNFRSRNFAVRNEERVNFQLEQLSTSTHLVRRLLPNLKYPDGFDKLGRINFKGNFDGFFADFVADGTLKTDIGQANMDIRLNLREGRNHAQYSGDVSLIHFDLGDWVENADLGIISANLSVKEGYGLTAETIKAQLSGKIDSVKYKGYNYKDLTINGFFQKNLFNGKFVIKDDNLDLNFEGNIDFADKSPLFHFKSKVGKLDLKALNLMKENYVFAGDLDFSLQGKNLNDMVGQIATYRLKIIKGDKSYLIDSLIVNSKIDSLQRRHLNIASEVLNINIDGLCDLQQLPKALLAYIARNQPKFAEKIGIKPNLDVLSTDIFNFHILIKNSKNITELFNNQLDTLKNIAWVGYFDNQKDSLFFNLEIPKIKYGTISFNDIQSLSNTSQGKGFFNLEVYSTKISDSLTLAPLSLLSSLKKDTIEFGISATNFSKVLDNFNFNGDVFITDDLFQIRFEPSALVILNDKWELSKDNYILLGKNFIKTHAFNLRNGKRQIILQTIEDKGVSMNFNNFNLDFVNNHLKYPPLAMCGRFDANVTVDDIFKFKDFKATLGADSVQVNKDLWGELRMKATMNDTKSPVFLNMAIIKADQSLSVNGFYTPPKVSYIYHDTLYEGNHLMANAAIHHFPLRIAEYFIGDGIANTIGNFESQVKVDGPLSKPSINGKLRIYNAATTIKYLNTRYTIKNETAKISSTMFDVTGAKIQDKDGNEAKIIGGIVHNHLKDFGLNVLITSPKIWAINTSKSDNPLYYGTGIGKAEARFTGSFQQTDINIKAVTGRGTRFFIPIGNTQAASEVKFIRFTDKKTDTNKDKNKPVVRDLRGVSLDMQLSITEDAEIQLIFDEKSGDIIKSQGKGDLHLGFERGDPLEMSGIYEIARGEYLFTLPFLVNKPFSVRQGGSIRWNGNPFDAQLNLEADYKGLSTSPYNLISGFSNTLSDYQKREARKPTKVALTLFLQGKLLQPDISFNIDLPNLASDLKALTDTQLRLYRQDKNELNRQVFGLLVVGSFLPPDQPLSTEDYVSTGVNTLTQFVSSQLSKYVSELFSDVLKGGIISAIDLDINYNVYRNSELGSSTSGGLSTIRDEWQFRPHFNLFDDKVSVNIGIISGTNISGNSYVNGDWSVEYMITDDRRWKIRAYQRPEQDFGGVRDRFGGGIVYRREFDSFKELFNRKSKKTEK